MFSKLTMALFTGKMANFAVVVVQLVAKFDKIYRNLSINLDSRPVFSL